MTPVITAVAPTPARAASAIRVIVLARRQSRAWRRQTHVIADLLIRVISPACSGHPAFLSQIEAPRD